jgi:hypothetical protein
MLRFCAIGGHANASNACVLKLNELVDDWNAIAVPGGSAAGQVRPQSPDHEHSASEVWYMRSQLRLALRLCNEDNDHEAYLRMDVVRAWLKLPEVRHPVGHRYRFDAEPRPPN